MESPESKKRNSAVTAEGTVILARELGAWILARIESGWMKETIEGPRGSWRS